MARLRDIVIDSTSAPPLARFWADALDDYHVRAYDEAEIARLGALGLTPETDPSVAVDGPGPTLFIQQVPGEPQSAEFGKHRGRNRIHLDLVATDRGKEVTRLCALGASVRTKLEDHTVMLDPQGNPFCVRDSGPAD